MESEVFAGDGQIPAIVPIEPPTLNRQVPPEIPRHGWLSPDLDRLAVPLPRADTHAAAHFSQNRLGALMEGNGSRTFFTPQIVLVKFKSHRHVAVLRTEPFDEWNAVTVLAGRADVEFTELDRLQVRQFVPDDTQLASQWHHSLIGSHAAWDHTLGSAAIKIAIVDSPFQMDHPDLVANVDPGWSVIHDESISSSEGISHSTLGAGLAAAVVHNGVGGAGIGNFRVLPIQIVGFTSEMYDAIIWAADHGVRVVNVSWSGADSPTLNQAGLYLKETARGLLVMAGVNGLGALDYPDHPHIWCVSSTDAADNPQSRHGDHIDFAAPGEAVFSTTTSSGYATGSGTSFAAPLVAGSMAMMLAINPTLTPDSVTALLIQTAEDKGEPGRDPHFGWGRIHLGRAALAATATLPVITSLRPVESGIEIVSTHQPDREYSLWRSPDLTIGSWAPADNAGTGPAVEGFQIWLDPDASPGGMFYQVRMSVPQP